jgi:hypothetical protein
MRYAILVALLMAVAFGCGAVHGNTETKIVKVRVIKYKDAPKAKTVTKYEADPDCLAYKDKAFEIATQAEMLYGLGPEQLQIVSQGREALAAGSVTELNDVENRQRRFDAKANEPVIELANLLDELENLEGCKE